MTAPAITAWAIKAPSGGLLEFTIRDKETSAKAAMVLCGRNRGWDDFYEEGYRCVRVTVQEMQE